MVVAYDSHHYASDANVGRRFLGHVAAANRHRHQPAYQMIDAFILAWDRMMWELRPGWEQCPSTRRLDYESEACCIRHRGHRGRHRQYNGKWFHEQSDIEERQ